MIKMSQESLKQAVDFAKKNPNDPRSRVLLSMINKGQVEIGESEPTVATNAPTPITVSTSAIAATEKEKKVKEIEKTQKTEKKEGLLTKISGKLFGLITKPVELVEQLGATLGTVGLSKEQKEKALKDPAVKQLLGGTPALGIGETTPYVGAREITEDTIKAALTLATPFLGGASTVAGRVGIGAGFGAGLGAAESIGEGGNLEEVAKRTIIGAGVGGATVGTFEALGYALNKTGVAGYVQRKAGDVFNKIFKPNLKEMAGDIEKGFTTFGEEARKYGYKGSVVGMRKQAENSLPKLSSQIQKEFKNFPNARVNKEEIGNSVLDKMIEQFGDLTDGQLKTVQNELNRLGNEMNLAEALKARQLVDGLMNKSALAMPTEQTAFLTNLRYSIRDELRRGIEAGTGNTGIIRELNRQIGTALDLRHLATLYEAAQRRGTGQFAAPKSLGDMLVKALERTIFKPEITTRAAQTVTTKKPVLGALLEREIIEENTR